MAGTYTTTTFRAGLSYTVPDGWANFEDLPGQVLLIPPGGSLRDIDAGTSDYLSVNQGVAVVDAGCRSAFEPGTGRSAEAMTAALAERPGIVVSQPEPIEVGDLHGLMIDIVVDPEWTGGCPGWDGPIVPLIIGAGPAELEHAAVPGQTTRLYVLDFDATNIVVEVEDVDGSSGTIDDYLSIISDLKIGRS
jgi:hypothetical protein